MAGTATGDGDGDGSLAIQTPWALNNFNLFSWNYGQGDDVKRKSASQGDGKRIGAAGCTGHSRSHFCTRTSQIELDDGNRCFHFCKRRGDGSNAAVPVAKLIHKLLN